MNFNKIVNSDTQPLIAAEQIEDPKAASRDYSRNDRFSLSLRDPGAAITRVLVRVPWDQLLATYKAFAQFRGFFIAGRGRTRETLALGRAWFEGSY